MINIPSRDGTLTFDIVFGKFGHRYFVVNQIQREPHLLKVVRFSANDVSVLLSSSLNNQTQDPDQKTISWTKETGISKKDALEIYWLNRLSNKKNAFPTNQPGDPKKSHPEKNE